MLLTASRLKMTPSRNPVISLLIYAAADIGAAVASQAGAIDAGLMCATRGAVLIGLAAIGARRRQIGRLGSVWPVCGT